VEHFAYYTLRIRSAAGPDAPPPPTGGELCGVVERLDTGEKHGFETGQELLRLVGGGIGGPNMHVEASTGNARLAEPAAPAGDPTARPGAETRP